jgi:ATP-dependent helicase/nuclease subunit A
MSKQTTLRHSSHLLQQPSPAELQSRASDPGQSVWVAASAGSGKTKVLTDRVLRLLLPGPDGQQGTPPERILCLTFTKAGAAEMAVRINQALAAWAIDPDAKVHENLTNLLGQPPSPSQNEAARRLFARVIDAEGGLKIMTIHSFCQSVLGRFPLEAGLPPHFTLIDERTAQDIQRESFDAVLRSPGDLAESIDRLSQETGEADTMKLLQALMGERMKLSALLQQGSLYGLICKKLRLDPAENADGLMDKMVTRMDESSLRRACAAMAADRKSKQMAERGPLLQAMLDADPEDRPALLPEYKQIFLKKSAKKDEDPIFAKLVTNPVRDADPEAESILREEAERLLTLNERIKTVRCAGLSHDLLRIGAAVLGHYQLAKAQLAALDYDDLIACTLDLLSGKSMDMEREAVAPWVMYKLDQGIDHILVDEAQDTNPEQWDIIHALCAPFFEGSGARDDINRTIFAVGDEKQSIFGFQRAAPEKFRQAEQLYSNKAKAAQKRFESIPMTISFRSAASILALTDAVFDAMEPWKTMGLPDGTRVQHSSFREGQAGRVELWPLIETSQKEDPAPWTLPLSIEENDNAEATLARKIAATIKGWIEGGEILESHGRPMAPGDILILVRFRGTLVEHLVRTLKSLKIPVSGVDRMRLGEQIAVQDLLAAASFALLPEDDLTLACLLKSPLIGLSEEQLYETAIDRRGESLWSAAKTRLSPPITQWLSALIATAGTSHPYEFFSKILHTPCPTDPQGSGLRAMVKRLGEDSVDPLEEFLNTSLQYESDHTPSLQQFLHWQAEGNSEIKREMEGASNKVRIMTVHGSKGLQAPIVILPDTVHTTASITKTGPAERMIWADGEAMLWSPREENDCLIYADLLADRKARLAEEYNRLLYVALTRAADRLYIAGCVKGARSKPADECWYKRVERAFDALKTNCPEGYFLEEGPLDPDKLAPSWQRICNPQISAPDRKRDQAQSREIVAACNDWSWLDRTPPEEETPPRPFMPSRPSDPDPAMRSPLEGTEDTGRFRRGIITHQLLQFLPTLPPDRWPAAAVRFVAAQNLVADVGESIVSETLAILTHPDFAALFGPGSMAEVPVTGLIGQTLISGQIDRLLVTESEVIIVDYKTNRPPPADPKDTPKAYRTQLKAYRDTLTAIYPGRAVRSFLLWTDGPRMVEIGPRIN